MDTPPAAVALTDDLLSEVFLRLPAPDDLARASATCVPYRRLAADRAFLRRFRALHPPPFLGFLDHNGFHPALPPHASAPAARALALAADFSFSFIPSPGRWVVRDVRHGRVLLDRAPDPDDAAAAGQDPAFFTDLAVCDPLHRRCVLLPRIPDDLAASVEQPCRVEFGRWGEPFLAPLADDGAEASTDETSFRVISMAQCKAKLVAFAFSSSTGQWRAVASPRWSDLMAGTGVPSRSPLFFGRQYARGCFFWVLDRRDKLLVLDATTMEFSIADLPHGCHRRQIAVVEAEGGRVGMFTLRDHIADGAGSLLYTVRQDDGDASSSSKQKQWKVEKTIPLDPAFRHYISGATERHLLLLRFPEHLSSSGVHVSSSADGAGLECFSVDVKTLQFQKVCELKHHILRAHIYTNFPPPLSSPTI
ncbi:hypothetical protein ACP4OV_018902 [Aristida adscensionis]